MDDQSDRSYSRAPEVKDLVTLCRELNQNQVQYILIGGFAVILNGFVRGTKDIDLLIDPSKNNIKLLKKSMAHLPDNAISLIKDDEVEKYKVVRIADEIVIDLMAHACGIGYNEAKSEIDWKTIEDIQIPVASKELLIRMKDTIRPSDKMDVNFLKKLIAEENKATSSKKKS